MRGSSLRGFRGPSGQQNSSMLVPSHTALSEIVMPNGHAKWPDPGHLGSFLAVTRPPGSNRGYILAAPHIGRSLPIRLVRGHKVMLDADLTGASKEAQRVRQPMRAVATTTSS